MVQQARCRPRADFNFTLELLSANSRQDALQFFDAVAFGPVLPPLPA